MSGKIKLSVCLYFHLALMPATLVAQTPEELIVNIYAEELEYIADNRIEYLDERGGKAVTNRKNVLSSIVEQGVSLREYVGARSVVSSRPEFNKFLTSHKLDDTEELRLFNNYVKASLKEYSSMDKAESVPDIELALVRSRSRNKVKSEMAEMVTGGVMWTLANEMRVICKKTGPRGRFSYSLVIKGGFSDLPGLNMGEGPYVGDMLQLFDVAGMKWYDFKRAMKLRGIELGCRVSISDMEIYGSAPVSELRTLMVALSSIANDSKINPGAFAYYKSEVLGKENKADPAASADCMMRPDYRYTSFRYLNVLPEDFPARTEKYFKSLFSRVNDGVLILVGDLDLVEAQKVVEQTTGDFGTSKAYSVRPMVQYVMRSGNSSIDLKASGKGHGSADIVFSAEMPVTSSGYMALKIVRIELEKRLRRQMEGSDITVRETLEYFPYERVFLAVSCKGPESPEKMMKELKSALDLSLSTDIDANSLKTDKAVLTAELERRMGGPRGVIEAARLRYSDGKDYMNGYKAKVAGVNSRDVNAILKAIESGPSVDIIYK